MKVVGRVTVAESGYEMGRMRVLLIDSGGKTVIQRDTDRDGRFECDVGRPAEGTYRVVVLPPDTTELQRAIHEQEFDLGAEGTETSIELVASAARFEAVGVRTQLHWSMKSVQFSDGQAIEFSPNSLTLIVGANNSGKTRALREMATACAWAPSGDPKVVALVEMEPARPEQWLIRNWIRANFALRRQGNVQYAEFSTSSVDINAVSYDAATSAFLVYALTIEERLQFSRHHQLGGIEGPPSNMIDYLVRNDPLCKRISDETRAAFGVGLLTEFGPNVGFRVGEPSQVPAGDRASGMVRRAMTHLPKLDEAGDGMRSFVGTLVAVEACPHPILLIDEPEAFLHPPQARILGRKLAEASRTRQVVIATHSADIVLGALSAGGAQPPTIRIVRLQRHGTTNHATSLDPTTLSILARDPQWESTELLESMFHIGAVLCEADADRRFYRWLASDPDIAFVACNGKGGIAKAATALRRLRVPIAAISDFDVLANEGELRAIITALGGDPDLLLGPGTGYADIRAQLGGGKTKTLAQLSTELQDAMTESTRANDRAVFLKRVASITESAKAGYEAKKHGINKFSGGLHTTCKQLLDNLAGIGLFVVRHGELEGWRREGAADKNEWIAEAWELARKDPSAFSEARAFLGSVTEFLRS